MPGLWALDSETTGIDTSHSARPFFVTMCDEKFNLLNWEWDVCPLTRKPIIPDGELQEIKEAIASADQLVLQNTKFDFKALDSLQEFGWEVEPWDWSKVLDTLIAGHLLASNQPHDLTTMALVELGVNIKPYEDELSEAIKEARRIAKSRYPDWKIAKRGLEGMPSAKDSVAKYDMWLPRALVKEAIFELKFDLLPYHNQLPEVSRVATAQVRIDRQTKWGNPFVIGKDGSREDVIRKYARWIWKQPKLLAALPELYGKTIGCHCSPALCHGNVLRYLCHPWMTVLADYSNADSSVTLPLIKKQLEKIETRGLRKIYDERLKLLPIIYGMEARGITYNKQTSNELKEVYTDDSEVYKRVCINLTAGLKFPTETIGETENEPLEDLPINGASNALRKVIFEGFKLTASKQTPAGKDSMDKAQLEEWLETLPKSSKAYSFIQNLRDYRKRRTAISYIESYDLFKIDIDDNWARLYPSLNPTGTHTLRMSSQNPNEQQISKQELETLEEDEDGERQKRNAREMFGPLPDEEWWSFDAQNIERRIPVYECEEQAIIELFEKPNEAPYYGSEHALVAHIIFPKEFEACGDGKKFKEKYKSTLYQWTKNFGFALQYGCQEAKGDATAHVVGAYKKVKSRFKNQERLNQHWIEHANKFGFVETIPDKSVDPNRGYPLYCERTRWGKVSPTIPLSYHVQGTAMQWTCKAMTRSQSFLDQLNQNEILFRKLMQRFKTSKELRIGYHIVMQVHDEIVFKMPRGQGKEPWKTNLPIAKEIQRIMALGGQDIGIPLPVGMAYHAESWGKELVL